MATAKLIKVSATTIAKLATAIAKEASVAAIAKVVTLINEV